MGLAGEAQDNQRLLESLVSRAETYVDRASKCEFTFMSLLMRCPILTAHFPDYKRIEDIRGECDTLFKKSVIARSRGDTALAEDWAGRYITLYNSHMTAIADEDDVPGSHSSEDIDL
jgi:hypothetical protein